MKTKELAGDRLKELIESGEINSLDAAKQEGFIKGWAEAQETKLREAAEMSLETMNILLNELPKDGVVLINEVASRKKQLEKALK